MRTDIQTLLERAISEELFPGAVAAWIDPTGEEQSFAVGRFTYDPHSPQVTPATQYDVASITKSIPTSSLALVLAEQGRLDLDQLVRFYLPDYSGDYPDQLTVRHLVEFSAPFSLTLSTLKNKPAEDIIDAILAAPLSAPPGSKRVYANTTSILLTLIIESVTQESIDTLADSLFFTPLGMLDTTFEPRKRNTAPSEQDAWRKGIIQGEVHDESAWKLQEIMVPGSAGLFSTASDLLAFAHMLLAPAQSTTSLFSQVTLQEMSTGLGWEQNATWMGNAPTGTFGKTGFTGCCIVINPAKGRAGILLSNSTWPHRSEEKALLMRQLREKFSYIVLK